VRRHAYIGKPQLGARFGRLFFWTGKNEGWFVISASLFSSKIGSEIILGGIGEAVC